MTTPLEATRTRTIVRTGLVPGVTLNVDPSDWSVLTSDKVQGAFDETDAALLRARDSGVFRGGVGSIDVGGTTVSITAGEGGFLDLSDPDNPVYTPVVWDAFDNVTPDTLAGQSWWYLDGNGDLQQTTTEPTDPSYRTRIWLFYTIGDGSQIVAIANQSVSIADTDATLHDMFSTFGVLRARGLTPTASGADLNLKYTAGAIRSHGLNRWADHNDPNTVEISEFDAGGTDTFYETTATAAGSEQTEVQVGYYQVAGVKTAIPGAATRWGIHLVFRGLSGTTWVAPGENYFVTSTEALSYLGRLSPYDLAFGLTRENAFIVGAVVAQKGATDLSDPAQALFVRTNFLGLFGGAVAQAAGDFLEASNNLSDLTDVETAQTNLEVYSITEVDSADAALALAIEELAASVGGGGSISLQGTWQYAGQTATPGWGQFGGNAATLAASTEFYLNSHKSDGVDVGTLLSQMETGDVVLGVSTVDATNKGRMELTSDATLVGEIVTMPGSMVSTEGSLVGWEQVSMVFVRGAVPVSLDDANAALIDDPASATSVSLSATYVTHVPPTADIQDYLDLADGSTRHVVKLAANTVYEISAALVMKSYTTLDMNGATLYTADGTDVDVLRNSDFTNGNDGIVVMNGYIDGNKANQTTGAGASRGLRFERSRGMVIENVEVRNCKGHGAYIIGNGVETRGITYVNLRVIDNDRRGLNSGHTIRDVTYLGVYAEGNGEEGVWIDHSEANVKSVIATDNRSHGIYLRNLHSSQVDGLVARRNDGFGILVLGLVESQGRGWLAQENCISLGTATDPDPAPGWDTTTADIYFTAYSSMSYGITRDTHIDGIHTVGDAALPAVNPVVEYGVYVEDGINDNLALTDVTYGEGGSVGDVRLPAPTASSTLLVRDETPDGGSFVRRGVVRDNQRCLYLPVTASHNATCPAVAISGDLDVRYFLATDDWASGNNMTLISMWGSGQKCFRLTLTSLGILKLAWSADGSTNTGDTGSTTAIPFAAGRVVGLRVTLDLDNGAGGYDLKFWYSFDYGRSWAQLGNTITGGSTTSLFASTEAIRLSEDGFGGNKYAHRVRMAEVYDGIDGTLKARFRAEGMAPYRDEAGNIWTLTGSGLAWTHEAA